MVSQFRREKPFRFIVDAHEDIAENAMQGRDFRLSALEKRKLETSPESGKGVATLGLPELLQGDVRIVFATLWARPATCPNPRSNHATKPLIRPMIWRESNSNTTTTSPKTHVSY